MISTRRGEVWLVDLGLVAKVRPCLVLSIPPIDQERVLVTMIAHTTSARNTRFECATNVRFLKPGAFDAQNIVTIPTVKLIRRLGALAAADMTAIESKVKLWLGLA